MSNKSKFYKEHMHMKGKKVRVVERKMNAYNTGHISTQFEGFVVEISNASIVLDNFEVNGKVRVSGNHLESLEVL